MAELDYAYLAEFARVEANSVTAVGASFTQVVVPAIPWQGRVTLVARIRMGQHDGAVPVGVQVAPPDGSFDLQFSADVAPGAEVRPYGGKVGLLFSLELPVPFPAAGLYVVRLSIAGEHVRRLAFDVSSRP